MQINIGLVSGFEELYQKYLDSDKHVFLDADGIGMNNLDVGMQSKMFFKNKLADISTDSNSNGVEDVSPSAYRAFTSNGIMKLLGYNMLWHYANKRYGKEFADKAISLIWDGGIYFHDAHGLRIQMPYCFAFSLDKIVFDGRPYGSSPNTPPHNRKSFLSQVDKLICDMSKQFAGATAPSDFFVWYAYFCKLEGIDPFTAEGRRIIEQDMQGIVCLFNEPNRSEGEPPFTNFGIYDYNCLHGLFDHIIYPDHSKVDFPYLMQIQKIFCEWFSNGDPITGFPYRFPVVTINITNDENGNFLDDDFVHWVAEVNTKKSNFNIHFGKTGQLAMCCRYENNLADMNLTPDSFGNGGINIGSHRVVTVNFPRVAMLSGGDPDKFIEILDDYMDVASKLLYVHRIDILKHRIEKNPSYLQFFGKLGWFDLDGMFSTIGIMGIYETCKLMGYDIVSDEGTEFASDLMSYINTKVHEFRKTFGYVYNVEEIPGEQACVSLVKKDKFYFGMGFGNTTNEQFEQLENTQLYSNQYIPLISNTDIVTRIDLSGRFMNMITGGGIVHANVDAPIDDPGKMYEILKFASKSGVPHIAICYRFGKCEDHKATIVGQTQKVCPICGKPIVWTRARVIGYFSDEINWSAVRRKYDAPHRHYAQEDELEIFDSEE